MKTRARAASIMGLRFIRVRGRGLRRRAGLFWVVWPALQRYFGSRIVSKREAFKREPLIRREVQHAPMVTSPRKKSHGPALQEVHFGMPT